MTLFVCTYNTACHICSNKYCNEDLQLTDGFNVRIAALKFCFKTCVAMKFVDDDDDDIYHKCNSGLSNRTDHFDCYIVKV